MMINPLLIIVLVLCGVQTMKNGRRAHETEFPFVVSIQYHLLHLCSGTIMDKYHILTVSHLVVHHPASSLVVIPGMSRISWPYTGLAVNNIYRHPDYHEWALIVSGQSELYSENNLAILRLTKPLQFTPLIGPVPLSTTSLESYRCFECAMISWNYPDKINMETVVLMWDIVYMVENNRCKQWGMQVLLNQQCFIDVLETASISSEDLGSSIICGGSMVGLIVKEARQKEATSPAIFLSTSNYIEFISEITNGGEKNVQLGEFPYIVSIWYGIRHKCGGIILNANHIITAAQCIQTKRGICYKERLKIVAGSNRIFDNHTDWYLVKHMKIHPLYLARHHVNDSSRRPEHDIAVITLSTPLSWSPTVQSFQLIDVDDFSTKQLCQVLHWTPRRTGSGRGYVELTKNAAVLVDDGETLVQLKRFQIAAKELYSMHHPLSTDIGNPIICRGYPLGIMVKTYPMITESRTPHLTFLHLRPYTTDKFFQVQ